MKREYKTPEMEICKFTLSVTATLTASVGDNNETLTEEIITPVKPKPFA